MINILCLGYLPVSHTLKCFHKMIGSDTALGSLPHWCLGLAKQSQNFAFESNRQMLDIHAFLYDAWFSPFCHFHFYHEGHGHGLLTQPWCCVGWLGFSSPTVHIFCLSLFSSPTDLPLWTFWFLFYFHHPCHRLSSGPGPPCFTWAHSPSLCGALFNPHFYLNLSFHILNSALCHYFRRHFTNIG